MVSVTEFPINGQWFSSQECNATGQPSVTKTSEAGLETVSYNGRTNVCLSRVRLPVPGNRASVVAFRSCA